MKSSSRRKFITDTAKAGVGTIMVAPIMGALLSAANGPQQSLHQVASIGFDQQPLPYAYNALEPCIDATTMDIHYNKHAAAYAKNLKEAIATEKASNAKSVEELLATITSYSAKMRNNGGGHYNHELFWKCLTPVEKAAAPTGKLLTALNDSFGSVDAFKTLFSDAAKTRFGSGWAWLIVKKDHKLAVVSTPNQDNPLMNLPGTDDVKGFPLLALDVWEHAYYLKYQNKRADYVENYWKIVNWNYVAERLASM